MIFYFTPKHSEMIENFKWVRYSYLECKIIYSRENNEKTYVSCIGEIPKIIISGYEKRNTNSPAMNIIKKRYKIKDKHLPYFILLHELGHIKQVYEIGLDKMDEINKNKREAMLNYKERNDDEYLIQEKYRNFEDEIFADKFAADNLTELIRIVRCIM